MTASTTASSTWAMPWATRSAREDIGIIKTDPLDADTDNDMRSDGDEAELEDVELKRWVVRATGAVKSGEVSTGFRVPGLQ